MKQLLSAKCTFLRLINPVIIWMNTTLPHRPSCEGLFSCPCILHRHTQLEHQTPWRNRRRGRCLWTSCRRSWAGRRWQSWWGWSWWARWSHPAPPWPGLPLCWARMTPRTSPRSSCLECKPWKRKTIRIRSNPIIRSRVLKKSGRFIFDHVIEGKEKPSYFKYSREKQ